MKLQSAPAPGRAAAEQPKAPAPNQVKAQEEMPGSAHEAGAGPAGSSSSGAFGGMALLVPFLLLFGLLFWMNRGEKRKRQSLEGKLKKGDRVITRSGIVGKLVEVSERTVKVEIAPGVSVLMYKSGIEGLEGGEAKGEAASSADKIIKAAKDAEEKDAKKRK
ncbi:MAG: preprotein translocase subunit YajC [Deltaproteobacteria bacterium]|nr:preprotein translocase subunit YajC [Deltaproteobacteria bacterium]